MDSTTPQPQLLTFPPMAKRPCCCPRVSKPDPMDCLLESLLSLSDASASSLGVSFDRLIESRACDSDQIELIERAMSLGSVLLEAGKRSERKRATRHNSVAWPLPSDITIKIFSMLDTQSVCYAAASFSFFRKCAEDSSCYSNINLTTESLKVNNQVVSTMIHRAGKFLRSLRLGIVPGRSTSVGGSEKLMGTIRSSADASGFSWTDKRSRQGKESIILTRSCLSSLNEDGGASGALLRRLHICNIERMDNAALGTALSACPSLCDLEIVGLNVELGQTLESVSLNCHLIERLHFESSKTGRDDSLKTSTCRNLVSHCPCITSLALKGFKLHDCKVRVLVKGFQKLKCVDFSTSYSVTGSFLRNLGTSIGGNLLEVLILRDCMHLKEEEMSRFLNAVVSGDFKLLRHLDISNREGLQSEGDLYYRCCRTSFIPVKPLFEGRPGFCLLAEFPQDANIPEIEELSSNDSFVVTTSPSGSSSNASDGAMHTTSSDNSSTSDSDEVDFFLV